MNNEKVDDTIDQLESINNDFDDENSDKLYKANERDQIRRYILIKMVYGNLTLTEQD